MSYFPLRSSPWTLRPLSDVFRSVQWRPDADIYRIHGGWLVKLDLAGVSPGDIGILVQGSSLTIRGIRRDCLVEEGATCYSMEISYSEFERSIEFSTPLNPRAVQSEYRDGMLLIRLASLEDHS